ncbi:MAG: SDR family NAD(P)-dependent oxidoreductase [Pseudomonadota bacterium]
MEKTILITGATDGIGLETAKLLAAKGHNLLIHGRSDSKLTRTSGELKKVARGTVATYRADLSKLDEVKAMANAILETHTKLDVVINNAGVFKTNNPRTNEGLDVRFIVNTVAPYLLTKLLLPAIPSQGRVINLSSAAQAPVNLEALVGTVPLDDNQAYAQSKLAITMWSFHLARSLGPNGPVVVAVNPASFLGSKMVKEAYGMQGNDLSVGADILVRGALSDEFADATGKYYDNDQQRFAAPHSHGLDSSNNQRLVEKIEAICSDLLMKQN